jgi:hypothetical protein
MTKKKKKVVVNRKFLMDLAQLIYDPETQDFLRLCDGTLQNGPDPTDEERSMHCGLGELYFEMTGNQPKDEGVDEDDVVNVAVELSTLPKKEEILRDAIAKVRSLKLGAVTDRLVECLEETDDSDLVGSAETNFRLALDAIPGSNDDGCGDGACSVATFRKRSQRVAKALRDAAKNLPA